MTVVNMSAVDNPVAKSLVYMSSLFDLLLLHLGYFTVSYACDLHKLNTFYIYLDKFAGGFQDKGFPPKHKQQWKHMP